MQLRLKHAALVAAMTAIFSGAASADSHYGDGYGHGYGDGYSYAYGKGYGDGYGYGYSDYYYGNKDQDTTIFKEVMVDVDKDVDVFKDTAVTEDVDVNVDKFVDVDKDIDVFEDVEVNVDVNKDIEVFKDVDVNVDVDEVINRNKNVNETVNVNENINRNKNVNEDVDIDEDVLKTKKWVDKEIMLDIAIEKDIRFDKNIKIDAVVDLSEFIDTAGVASATNLQHLEDSQVIVNEMLEQSTARVFNVIQNNSSGNFGINNAEGYLNQQKNDLALASFQGAAIDLLEAEALSEQWHDNLIVTIQAVMNTNATIDQAAVNSTGNAAINNASGAANQQSNALALAVGDFGTLAEATVNIEQLATNTQVTIGAASTNTALVQNSITNFNGNVGFNNAAGAANQQANGVSVASANCTGACLGNDNGGGGS